MSAHWKIDGVLGRIYPETNFLSKRETEVLEMLKKSDGSRKSDRYEKRRKDKRIWMPPDEVLILLFKRTKSCWENIIEKEDCILGMLHTIPYIRWGKTSIWKSLYCKRITRTRQAVSYFQEGNRQGSFGDLCWGEKWKCKIPCYSHEGSFSNLDNARKRIVIPAQLPKHSGILNRKEKPWDCSLTAGKFHLLN